MSKSKRKLKQKGPAEGKPKRGSQQPTVNPDVPHQYKRALWKHLIRYFVAFTGIMLNVSMVMSFITRMMHHRTMDPFKELFFFGFVAFIDVFMFVPVIFEVNKVETDRDSIRLTTLLWGTKIPWDKVTRFEQPRFLKFAFLRTARCFYLINKRDINPFYELASIITAKITAKDQDRIEIQDNQR